jgi:hypothetical protein
VSQSCEACEVCGAPATVAVKDVRETLPRVDGGNLWACHEADGPTHLFCREHCRQPRRARLPDYLLGAIGRWWVERGAG